MKKQSIRYLFQLIIMVSLFLLTSCSFVEQYVDLPEIKMPKLPSLGKNSDLPSGMSYGCYCGEDDMICFLPDNVLYVGDELNYRKIDDDTLEIYTDSLVEENPENLYIDVVKNNEDEFLLTPQYDEGDAITILKMVDFRGSKILENDVIGSWQAMELNFDSDGQTCSMQESGSTYEFTADGKLIEDGDVDNAENYDVYKNMLILNRESVLPFYFLGDYMIIDEELYKKSETGE
jgi:hypothetical protein